MFAGGKLNMVQLFHTQLHIMYAIKAESFYTLLTIIYTLRKVRLSSTEKRIPARVKRNVTVSFLKEKLIPIMKNQGGIHFPI